MAYMKCDSAESVPIMPVTNDVAKDLCFPKVELHVHLDGAVRHETLLQLSLEKGLDLKGAKTVDDVRKIVTIHAPTTLSKMLIPFDIFLPLIAGDKDAIERIAYELCEDQSKQGVIYFEARYSPHLLCNTANNHNSTLPGRVFEKKGLLYPRGVVEAVKRGFDRGEATFGVKARSILCCICGYPDWNDEILELASTLASEGVVGIDVAGCSRGADEQYEPNILGVFQEAAKRGIHRTMHAGESGGAKEVVKAIEDMKAERIGHGYRLLLDEIAYQKYAVQERVHLETCPYSSVMTGSVPLDWPHHPIARLAADDANFSINTDDPTCFENTLMTEYQLAYKQIGLTKLQLWKCSLNAALSSFAEEDVKQKIVAKIIAAKPSD
uniref:Adenosine deaminase n=1 Tax=Ascaris lumbricoides TaxID=6252 RepID=A0A9J2PPI3_ASCLU